MEANIGILGMVDGQRESIIRGDQGMSLIRGKRVGVGRIGSSDEGTVPALLSGRGIDHVASPPGGAPHLPQDPDAPTSCWQSLRADATRAITEILHLVGAIQQHVVNPVLARRIVFEPLTNEVRPAQASSEWCSSQCTTTTWCWRLRTRWSGRPCTPGVGTAWTLELSLRVGGTLRTTAGQ